MGHRTIKTRADVLDVLSGVTFAPSCVDMAWEWQVVDAIGAMIPPLAGWLVRCSFQRPDRTTGKVERGFGRWWFVREGESESGLVKTAFSAAKMNIEHELMEAFRYRGVRIFDPHHTVDQLGLAASAGGTAR